VGDEPAGQEPQETPAQPGRQADAERPGMTADEYKAAALGLRAGVWPDEATLQRFCWTLLEERNLYWKLLAGTSVAALVNAPMIQRGGQMVVTLKCFNRATPELGRLKLSQVAIGGMPAWVYQFVPARPAEEKKIVVAGSPLSRG
jgi:hypothetical protein